jgi:predicted nucleic acid-binding protein
VTFLLDTNVVSEWAKPRPDPNVIRWLDEVDEDRVFLSVASFAEIRDGVECLPTGERRARLAAWLADDLPTRFDGRVLGIDRRIAETWGIIVARARHAGVAVDTMDAFLAATAQVHGLTLATRNARDFARVDVSLFNPWGAQP